MRKLTFALLFLVFGSATGQISHHYPLDAGIENDKAVLYAEGWERTEGPPSDWWVRTGPYSTMRLNYPSKWPVRSGVPFPPAWGQADLAVGEGALGGNALRNTFWTQEWGTGSPTYDVAIGSGQEREHLFARFYVKFDPRVSLAYRCDGGKLPGFAGRTDVAGNSGGRVDGTDGWSLRGGYGINCPHEARHPQVNITTYAYHADMKGTYGDHWSWGSVDAGKWICVEQELRVNTPGVRDGVLRGWINGELRFEKLDVYLRGLPPYHSKLGTSQLAIRKWWGTHHHGGAYGMFEGRLPPAEPMEAYTWIDQTVVATERIGCMTREKMILEEFFE